MPKYFERIKKEYIFASLFQERSNKRAFSSAGSEHLPYKQRVGGSNPSTPTVENEALIDCSVSAFSFGLTLERFHLEFFSFLPCLN